MTIRHNCKQRGCYVDVHSPDWGFLDQSFSGKIKVTDIDGAVEANGHLLIIEWKGIGVPIPIGQKIMFEKITARSDITVYVVNGDPAKNEPITVQIFFDGSGGKVQQCNQAKLQNLCTRWETYARNN